MAEVLHRMSEQVGYSTLRRNDPSWDYRGESTKSYTHGLHSYPAMMIPQVACRLIEKYSREGDILLDPFCGSGSVLVEARVAKRYSWGIDLNPLAILIAKVKTMPIAPYILYAEYNRFIDRIQEILDDEVSLPNFYNLNFWFKEPVIKSLARIKSAIDKIEIAEVKELFQVTFSEVVRLSSNTRSHEFKLFRYSEDKLKDYNPDPLRLFMKKIEANIERKIDFYKACPLDIWSRVVQADSTKPVEVIEPGSVMVIVTSPPYGDSRTTVAYGQFSRLSSQWLGLMPERAPNIDNEMLGGKIRDTGDINLTSPSLNSIVDALSEKDIARSRQVQFFYIDLFKCLRHMADYLKVGGYACIVIGNRRVKGMQLPTDIIICELAQAFSLIPQQIVVRNIPSKTMPLRNSPTNVRGVLEETMHKEYIVILKKS